MVNQWSINSDPMYWENPLSFEPDRFLGSNNVDFKGHDFEFITFGTGRRICPRMPLAMLIIPLVVASLVCVTLTGNFPKVQLLRTLIWKSNLALL